MRFTTFILLAQSLVLIPSIFLIAKGITSLREDFPEGSVYITPELYKNVNNQKNAATDEDIRKDKIHTQPQQHDESPLPEWIEDYISWHTRMRLQFPGKAIITDPNAPPVLVRACLTSKYGGLHDRVGQLPFDLYLANQTKRVLLIKWIKPYSLEEFLVPPENGLDWTFPDGVKNLTDNVPRLVAKNFRKRIPQLTSNVIHKEYSTAFEEMIDNNVEDLNYGKFHDTKVVRYAILATLDEDYLERKLIALGEKDMIHRTPTFGAIFKRFFQPHPNVQKEIDQASKDLGLIHGEYTIAHSRVCHPKAYTRGRFFDGKSVSQSDVTGLPFHDGEAKDLAIGAATRAIKCAATLPDVSRFPIYFIADSSDLVQYMTRDLRNKTYLLKHSDWFSDPKGVNATAKDLISKYHVVARDYRLPYTHLDKTMRRPVEEFYATFVDLYLTINARCVSYGIGYYASFGAKLSNTQCTIRYAKEKWGNTRTKPVLHEKYCSIPDIE